MLTKPFFTFFGNLPATLTFHFLDIKIEDNSKEPNNVQNSVESGLELLRKSYGSQTEGNHW